MPVKDNACDRGREGRGEDRASDFPRARKRKKKDYASCDHGRERKNVANRSS